MADRVINVPRRQIRRLLDKYEPNTVFEGIFQRFDQLSGRLAGIVIRDSLSGQRLNRRTGALARSTIGRAEMVNGVPAMRIGIFRGPALRYAAIQESGGVIKPRRAKNLAIPQEPVLTGAGVDRFGGPRGYPGELSFVPFRRGVATGMLVDESEAEKASQGEINFADVKALYILVKRVEIPASRWLSAPIRKNVPHIAREIRNYLKELLDASKD